MFRLVALFFFLTLIAGVAHAGNWDQMNWDTGSWATGPLAQNMTLSTNEDTPLSVSLTSTKPEDVVTYLVTQQPHHGVLSGTAPNLVYTPNQDFFGQDIFLFMVSDGSYSTSAAVTIVVNSTSDPASISAQPLPGTILTCDYTISVALQSSKNATTIYYTMDGMTPTNSSMIYSGDIYVGGNTTIKAIAVDSYGESSEVVSFAYQIQCPDSDNDGVNDMFDQFPNDPAASEDTDSDGWPDTWNAGYTEQNSTTGLALDAYPNDYDKWTDAIMVWSVSEWNKANWAKNVLAGLLAQNLSATCPEDGTCSITLAGSGEGTLSYAVLMGPKHGALAGTAPNFVYVPNSNFFGVEEFTYLVTNGSGNSEPATVQVTVTAVDDDYPGSASPAGGKYTLCSATMDISLLTSAKGDVSIYYTTDGSNPSNASSLYAGPVKIQGDTVLKYIVADAYGDASSVKTETYTFDCDTDGDGVADSQDAFPYDPAASVDADNDGYPDQWNDGMSQANSTTGLEEDLYPGDSLLWNDGPEQANGTVRILYKDKSDRKGQYQVGDSFQLYLNYRNATGGDSDISTIADVDPVQWVSSNKNTAFVEQNGTVTFIGVGPVVIRAYTEGMSAELRLMGPDDALLDYNGNLILVAGGTTGTGTTVDTPENIAEAIQQTTKRMRDVFMARGYSAEDIWFLNEKGNNSINANTVNATVMDTATLASGFTWAAEQNNSGPLFVYLSGHADKYGTFLLGGQNQNLLSAKSLDGMLDTFELKTQRKSVIIIEACYSGSFIDDLADSDRVIMASSAADQPSFMGKDGMLCFTQALSNSLLAGQKWDAAFDNATAVLHAMGEPFSSMTPQVKSGTYATATPVYNTVDYGPVNPVFANLSAGEEVNAGGQSLAAKLDQFDASHAQVWATVQTPDYEQGTVSKYMGAPDFGLDVFELANVNGSKTFEGSYTFVKNGNYTVVFHARNREGNVASSSPQTWTVVGEPTSTTKTNYITCGAGWHLLALPLKTLKTSIANVLGDHYSKCTSIWAFEGNNWKVRLPSYSSESEDAYIAAKGFGKFETIQPGVGFWINAQETMTIPFSGDDYSGALTAPGAGWSMKGHSGVAQMQPADLASQLGSVETIWKWKDNNWQVYMPGESDNGAAWAASKGFSLIEGINPGEGYWVNTK